MRVLIDILAGIITRKPSEVNQYCATLWTGTRGVAEFCQVW